MSFPGLLRAIGAAGILLVATASSAAGHVAIVSSSPVAGANLETAPTEVTITFDDELNPDASSFAVTDSDDVEVGVGEVDLSVADRNAMTGAVSITDPGVYTVSYTVAGVDGHAIEGTFSFGFQATGEIPGPSGGEEPDTAMARPGPANPALVALGCLLLVAAGAALGASRSIRM